MSDPIRLVVADDQGMIRAGFRSLLDAEPDLEVVGEAANGVEALDVVRDLQPDVTLMDIRMPELDGISATRQLVAEGAATRVLVLTTFDLDEYVFEALRAGASGFMLKDAPADELAAAIRVVAAGESLLAPSITRRVIDAFVGRAPSRPAHAVPDAQLGRLTPRELEVLGLMARGKLQRGDLLGALRLRGDHQDPRQQRAGQARAQGPGPGGDLRLRARRGGARVRPARLTSADVALRRAPHPRGGGGSPPAGGGQRSVLGPIRDEAAQRFASCHQHNRS